MTLNVKKSKFIRFLSAFLASLTICGTFTGLDMLPAYAANRKEADKEEEVVTDYYKQVFATPEMKLATMKKMASAYGYELYYEEYTGEIALVNTKTGQVLFSNPYDIATSHGSDETKNALLSQLIIKYKDNDQEKNYYSFVEAAKRKQIKARNIKNGIRVEYTIGKEETRNLVPRCIEKSRFENLLLKYMEEDETAYKKMKTFYLLKDASDPDLTVRGVKEMQSSFPITKSMAVYVFAPDAVAREINMIEAYIKRYCPHYSFTELDVDHRMTEYKGSDTAPALFKMALEYYINEDGLQVRLPANSIRFDESTYQLTHIQVLPYMGAGNYNYKGYTFIPDGSGSIIRFEDFAGKQLTLSGKVYGQDFSYHQLSGAHQEAMRLPVYGVAEHVDIKDGEYELITKEVDKKGKETEKKEKVKYSIDEYKGFLAIITEGDALANITTSHGGALHQYATVYPQFYPRPKDSYNLAESISVGANATWTVVSKRKYTGSYRIQYIMLTDPRIAKDKGISDYYKPEWTGMADAYRDYLTKNELISKNEFTNKDIPLYLETFGTMQTKKVILSIPVMVQTPLTTMEDMKTIHQELSAEGVSNIVFRLNGFTNGGMVKKYPAHVKFQSRTGGNKGYADFVEYSKQNGISVYPDFDFMYLEKTGANDGVSLRKDLVKTIDNRYSRHRIYDSVHQKFTFDFKNAISPSVLEKLYGKFVQSYAPEGSMGISVSTMGSDLNSDFDKKEPYNREDSKAFVLEILDKMKADYGSLMLDAGNAYALKYASHLLNVALDSSRYYYSSQSVPFMGMVLHGNIPFAGTPTNMAGDIKYEMLKIIENGASPYFILAYQNTSKIKENEDLCEKYYSTSYQIWKEDLVGIYKTLNEALGSLQDKEIVDHEFILGERVPTPEEIAEDNAAEQAKLKAEEEAEALKKEKAELARKLAERKAAEAGEELPEPAPEKETPKKDEEKDKKPADGEEYEKTKYTTALGTIVKVTYEGGTSFILNYNSYAVKVDGKTIDAYGFAKIG